MKNTPILLFLLLMCLTSQVNAQLTISLDTLHVGGINDKIWDWEKNYNLGTTYLSSSGIATDISITNHGSSSCELNLSDCRFGYIYYWDEKYNIIQENSIYSKDSILIIQPNGSVKFRFPSSSISLHTFIGVSSMDWFAQIIPSIRFFVCTPDGALLFSGPYQVLNAQQYLIDPTHITWRQYFAEKRQRQKQWREAGLSPKDMKKQTIVMHKTLGHPFRMEDFYERLSKCTESYIEQPYPTIDFDKLPKPLIEDDFPQKDRRKF